eukprot:PhM_4_TR3298/c0_g1_i1/m.96695
MHRREGAAVVDLWHALTQQGRVRAVGVDLALGTREVHVRPREVGVLSQCDAAGEVPYHNQAHNGLHLLDDVRLRHLHFRANAVDAALDDRLLAGKELRDMVPEPLLGDDGDLLGQTTEVPVLDLHQPTDVREGVHTVHRFEGTRAPQRGVAIARPRAKATRLAGRCEDLSRRFRREGQRERRRLPHHNVRAVREGYVLVDEGLHSMLRARERRVLPRCDVEHILNAEKGRPDDASEQHGAVRTPLDGSGVALDTRLRHAPLPQSRVRRLIRVLDAHQRTAVVHLIHCEEGRGEAEVLRRVHLRYAVERQNNVLDGVDVVRAVGTGHLLEVAILVAPHGAHTAPVCAENGVEPSPQGPSELRYPHSADGAGGRGLFLRSHDNARHHVVLGAVGVQWEHRAEVHRRAVREVLRALVAEYVREVEREVFHGVGVRVAGGGQEVVQCYRQKAL